GCRLWLVPVRRAPGWSHHPGGGSDHCLWALHPDARASGRFTSASGNAGALWQRDGDRPALEPVAAPDARTWLISGTRRFLRWVRKIPPCIPLLQGIPAPHGRSVAQPGSAPASGAGGRRFESSRSDQFFFVWIATIVVPFGHYPSSSASKGVLCGPRLEPLSSATKLSLRVADRREEPRAVITKRVIIG